MINAGGAAAFKHNLRLFSFDDIVPIYGVSSRDIVLALQSAVEAIGVGRAKQRTDLVRLGQAMAAALEQAKLDIG